MAAPDYQPEVIPSLVDRLIDLHPESQREASVHPWQQMREVQAALCRDLTALLNTRRAADDFDRTYRECANSLLTFGILDFTSANLKSGMEQEQLRRSIERAIRQFEPRLARVVVSIEEADPQRPVLRLQISAVLRVEPAEPVFLSAVVQRDSRRILVAGGA